MSSSIAGIQVPDSAMAREITELVRDTASPLLFHHSSRVFYFAALAGQRLGLRYDSELLYAGCMFHDMGLTHQHSSDCCRFEVDGANAARDFLQRHGVDERDVERVWTAIALHTTPGIPEHMHPLIALVTAGWRPMCWGCTTKGWKLPHGTPWSRRTRVGKGSRRRSFRRFTTASGTSRRPRLAT